MAQERKDTKVIKFDQEARSALLRGAKTMADTVGLSYGPKGRNVIIEKSYGRPMITRDGVTISKEVYSEVRDENMGMQLLNEAAESTVRAVGDGTTQTVVLTYQLIEGGQQLIAAGKNPMDVKDLILKDSYKLLDRVKELSQEVEKGQLEQVAAVSSGDEALGKLIAEAVEKVGSDGGIITQRAPIASVDRTYADGYYQSQGFNAIESGKKELSTPYVVVSSKQISTGPEVIKLVNVVVEKLKEDGKIGPNGAPTEPFSIAFFGEFEGLAYDTIIANVSKGVFDGVVIKSPMQGGDMAPQYLEDIALYCGARMVTKSDKLEDLDASYVGKAEKITATNSESTIFGGEGAKEDIDKRLADIKDRIAKEEIDAISEKLKERVSKLEGKIAIFRIGGANDTEREEREFRIDDSIQASKAAAQSGIVAGGGATLVELSKCDVSGLWQDALQNTFRKLVDNAALPADVKLNELLASTYPHGFNLRKGPELVDVIAAGVVDPTKVVEQIVLNAASTAANSVSVGAVITFTDREVK